MADRFDRLTERAREVLSYAQEEAQRLKHNYISTEHLLLGLIREGSGVASKILFNLGVDSDQLRSQTEFSSTMGQVSGQEEVGFTTSGKKVLGFAEEEARSLKHQYIGTEHLLLGLLREEEGIASGVLRTAGITREKVLEEVQRILPHKTNS